MKPELFICTVDDGTDKEKVKSTIKISNAILIVRNKLLTNAFVKIVNVEFL